MKLYTRGGDTGQTALLGGQRVSKAHPVVEALGAVDGLNAALGIVVAQLDDAELRQSVAAVQARLFDLGADLARGQTGGAKVASTRVSPNWSTELEADIDAMSAALPSLTGFILPGGAPGAAGLHLARTICRRAERRVAATIDAGATLNPAVLGYLNRLSDWLFVAARLANARAGVPDTRWHSSA